MERHPCQPLLPCPRVQAPTFPVPAAPAASGPTHGRGKPNPFDHVFARVQQIRSETPEIAPATVRCPLPAPDRGAARRLTNAANPLFRPRPHGLSFWAANRWDPGAWLPCSQPVCLPQSQGLPCCLPSPRRPPWYP